MSYLFHSSFTMPVFFKGRKKTLDERDLFRALNSHRSGKSYITINGIFVCIFCFIKLSQVQ